MHDNAGTTPTWVCQIRAVAYTKTSMYGSSKVITSFKNKLETQNLRKRPFKMTFTFQLTTEYVSIIFLRDTKVLSRCVSKVFLDNRRLRHVSALTLSYQAH